MFTPTVSGLCAHVSSLAVDVHRSQLREIDAEFLEWPVQVLRCALSDVQPVRAATDVTPAADVTAASDADADVAMTWDEESQARFGELCEDISGRDSK